MRATLPGTPEGATINVSRTRGLSFAMLLVGALLVGFSMGQWLAAPVAWVGPVLIIRYARAHSAGRGYPVIGAVDGGRR